MCRIFSIETKWARKTVTRGRFDMVNLLKLPRARGTVAIWMCSICGEFSVDIAQEGSESEVFLKHMWRLYSPRAARQLPLWENESNEE